MKKKSTETQTMGHSLYKSAEGMVEDARNFVYERPAQALALAAGAGFLMHWAPVRRLIAGLTRLSFALVGPALLGLGGVKIWEKATRHDVV